MSAGAPMPDWLAPRLFSEDFGQAVLELLDAGGQPQGAFVGGEQVGQ